ncbi:MAG: biotin--[acetyl-CoA-carboxylase] ligase, partial [Pseudomonadota bacterium]|nr:biotin--[acetyl-CoA-carboxylase] ligase [Pseudomonadota bacterium]
MTATWPTPGHVVVRPAVDSTNSEASRLLAAGADHGLVVRADCQSAGRGRRGRTWVSPPGNLYCSLLARPPISAPAPLATLTFVAALAVHQLVRAALPAARTVALKWPNDVLVDGAKVSGILLEGQHGGAGPAVIIGVGINLASHPAGAPYAVTDLAAGGGR